MRKILKGKKGVTLVALVVTVIILLILAAITINLTIGENGIITTAKQAGKNYQEAAENEQAMLAEFWSQTEGTISSATGSTTSQGSTITISLEDLNKIIDERIQNQLDEEKLNIYPVGSIYISTDDTNPSQLFGGTWESYGEGRTLIGAGTGTDTNGTAKTFTARETGGEYTHTLTIAEMPSHQHKSLKDAGAGNIYYASGSLGTWVNSESITSPYSSGTSFTGGGEAHNNVQPYIVTYMWERIS